MNAEEKHYGAWSCKVESTNFEENTITVKMRNAVDSVGRGEYWLLPVHPSQLIHPADAQNKKMRSALNKIMITLERPQWYHEIAEKALVEVDQVVLTEPVCGISEEVLSAAKALLDEYKESPLGRPYAASWMRFAAAIAAAEAEKAKGGV